MYLNACLRLVQAFSSLIDIKKLSFYHSLGFKPGLVVSAHGIPSITFPGSSYYLNFVDAHSITEALCIVNSLFFSVAPF